MIPKKSNKIYKVVSEDLNIQEKLVEDIVQFYYKELRSKMSGISHTRINIEGLGHVIVKPQIVSKAIERLDKVVKNHDTSTYNAYHTKKSMEEKLILLKQITIKLTEELADRKSFKEKKYESNTENNLGE
jgi:GTP cyclohydrolase I